MNQEHFKLTIMNQLKEQFSPIYGALLRCDFYENFEWSKYMKAAYFYSEAFGLGAYITRVGESNTEPTFEVMFYPNKEFTVPFGCPQYLIDGRNFSAQIIEERLDYRDGKIIGFLERRLLYCDGYIMTYSKTDHTTLFEYDILSKEFKDTGQRESWKRLHQRLKLPSDIMNRYVYLRCPPVKVDAIIDYAKNLGATSEARRELRTMFITDQTGNGDATPLMTLMRLMEEA